MQLASNRRVTSGHAGKLKLCLRIVRLHWGTLFFPLLQDGGRFRIGGDPVVKELAALDAGLGQAQCVAFERS